SAVEAMKLGAVDYIAKPFDHDELLMLIERTISRRRLTRQNEALKSDVQREYPVSGIIGFCPTMREVFSRIQKVAPTATTVLVVGESGTGKELVARALHAQSERDNGPMIAVNCAAIPDNLIESELFGHEKGSFTGAVDTHRGLVEAADGGTLFLDEVGELPLAAQARLLRVLQDGEIRRIGASQPWRVDVRLIAATHRDLRQLVEEKRFRDDLYFRLRVMEIRLPPLRERDGDVVELANYLLDRVCKRLHRSSMTFAPEAIAVIEAYSWPGNVRELENAIERAVILCDGKSITSDLLAIETYDHGGGHSLTPTGDTNASLDNYIRKFVLENQNTLTETELARRLGISRKTLWEKRQRLGIPRGRRKKPLREDTVLGGP
ncbi:MAG: sigma-54 dependent transcriptional regulator, partial [Gammaproteobacteria bacterium]|nr:sigma-54 dependent transcriptional regulator [Gammaproteobacteria bacterium]